jgi:hypothetical protein
MADNVVLPGTGSTVASNDVAVNGGSVAQVQYVKIVDGTANGTAGLPGDATNGLDVDVTRIGPVPTNSTTTALDNDGPVVKASAGTLWGFQGYVDAAGFVQVHNKASAPASTNVPVIVIKMDAAGNFSLNLGNAGRAFSTGIAFGFSTTGPTYTDGGSHLWVDVQYT